jgi:hypothetical protein
METQPYQIFLQGKVVAVCEAIIKEEIGIIAGSRKLVSLCFEMFDDNDSGFTIFSAIDSETDHLPVDFERRNWAVESLKRKDLEIAEYERATRDKAVLACQNLISRFSIKNEG